jgi:hypothetical protein
VDAGATMTMTAQADDRMDGGYKPMPLWLSIPLLLACLAAGFFIIRWYFNSAAVVKETSILGVAPPDGRTRYLRPNDEKNPTAWTGHTETAEVDYKVDKGVVSVTRARLVTGNRGGGGGNYAGGNGWGNAARYPSYIPDTTRKFLEGAAAAANRGKIGNTSLDKTVVDVLKAQTSQRNESTIQLGETDKAKLVADLNEFLAASDEARVVAEIKVLGAVDDLATSDEQVVKQKAEQQVEAIKKVLTPEQVAAIPGMANAQRQGGGQGGGGPGGGRGRQGP